MEREVEGVEEEVEGVEIHGVELVVDGAVLTPVLDSNRSRGTTAGSPANASCIAAKYFQLPTFPLPVFLDISSIFV